MTKLGMKKFFQALLSGKERKRKIVCASETNGLSLSGSPPPVRHDLALPAGQNDYMVNEKDDYHEGDVLELDQFLEICTLLDFLVAAGKQQGIAEGPYFVKEVHEFRVEPNKDARIRMAHSIQDRFLIEGCENFVQPMLSTQTCNQLEGHMLLLNPVVETTEFNGQVLVMVGTAPRTMFDRAVLDVLIKLLDPLQNCRETIYRLYGLMHLAVDSVKGGIIKEENSKKSSDRSVAARENAGERMTMNNDKDIDWFLSGCGDATRPTSSLDLLFNLGSSGISSASSS